MPITRQLTQPLTRAIEIRDVATSTVLDTVAVDVSAGAL